MSLETEQQKLLSRIILDENSTVETVDNYLAHFDWGELFLLMRSFGCSIDVLSEKVYKHKTGRTAKHERKRISKCCN